MQINAISNQNFKARNIDAIAEQAIDTEYVDGEYVVIEDDLEEESRGEYIREIESLKRENELLREDLRRKDKQVAKLLDLLTQWYLNVLILSEAIVCIM